VAEQEVNKDAEAKITIDKDRMKAYLEVEAPAGSGKVCDKEAVKKALADLNVVYGVKEELIDQVLQEENWGRKFVIAEGRPAKDGDNATISYNFPHREERIKPRVDEKGNVNYHDLGLIYNVQKGQPLAERKPPNEGVAGIDVCGQEIVPKRGKDIRLPKGKNTVYDEQERILYATIDGNVVMVNNKVMVEPVLNIAGNVDYSSGDIDFVGDVVVRGNINSGFKVRAQGDIEVNGFIEAAEVLAGGNILVKGGITAAFKGHVKAEGNICVRFVENSIVEAGGDVIVREGIMQSNIKAGGSVRVNARKAIIVGGHIQAREEVESKVLGSPLATQTIVEVGIDPRDREEFQHLLKEKTEKKKVLDNLTNNLQLIQKSGIPMEQYSEKKRTALIKMLDDYKVLRQEQTERENRIIQLEKNFERASYSKVKVHDIVYPGVRVSIGQAIYVVNDSIKYTAFILDQGEVRISSLR